MPILTWKIIKGPPELQENERYPFRLLDETTHVQHVVSIFITDIVDRQAMPVTLVFEGETTMAIHGQISVVGLYTPSTQNGDLQSPALPR